MEKEKVKLTKEEQQNAAWFIISVSGTIITIITATILINQFSRNYKLKSPVQHILFLFSGILMLCLGIYVNIVTIDYTNAHTEEYGKFILIPRLLLKINFVFLIYAGYTVIKRISSFLSKK